MWEDQKRQKEMILKIGQSKGNIQKICDEYQISRMTYYRWLKAYKEQGLDGLQEKERRRPQMPNQTPKEVEALVLKIAREFPDYGPRRIMYELENQNITLSYSGVYKILCRNSMNQRKMRENSAQQQDVEGTLMIQKSKKATVAEKEGLHLLQGTYFVGRIGGGESLYQLTVIDPVSRVSFVKLYKKRTTASAVELLRSKVLPIIYQIGKPIVSITTNAAREYTNHYRGGRHVYEEYLQNQNIEHLVAEKSEEFACLTEFQSDVYDSVYRKFLLADKSLDIRKINVVLKQYVYQYNFKQGKIIDGKTQTPMERLNAGRNQKLPVPIWMYVQIEDDETDNEL